jgi:hypothetical protein
MSHPSSFSGVRPSESDRAARSSSAFACGLLLLAGILALGVPSLGAQSAGQILEEALERHEERLRGVENLTLRQETLGHPTTVYMVKETVEGRAFLRTQSREHGRRGNRCGGSGRRPLGDPGRLYDVWGDRWSLEGQATVEGVSAWRLSLTDFEGIEFPESVPGQDLPFEPTRMVLELDQQRLVPLTMTMEGEAVQGGERRPVEVLIQFSDYREVEGYLHPFLMVIESDVAAAGCPKRISNRRAPGLRSYVARWSRFPGPARDDGADDGRSDRNARSDARWRHPAPGSSGYRPPGKHGATLRLLRGHGLGHAGRPI